MDIEYCLDEAVKTFRKKKLECERAKEIADDLMYASALSPSVALSFLKIWASATDVDSMTEQDLIYHNHAKDIYSLYLENVRTDNAEC